MTIKPTLAAWFAPTAWAVLWIALAVGTIVLIALIRTRWSGVKPWKKCALLSLWVHVLLACLAATIRIAGHRGPGIGPGSGGPIRVAFIAAADAKNDARPTAPPRGEPAAPLPAAATNAKEKKSEEAHNAKPADEALKKDAGGETHRLAADSKPTPFEAPSL